MSYDYSNLKNVEGKMLKHLVDCDGINVEPQLESGGSEERDIKFGGIEILEQSDQLSAELTPSSRNSRPSKPILKMPKTNKPCGARSSSCDFKRTIKNIDGVYIRKNQDKKHEKTEKEEEEKNVHFSMAFPAITQPGEKAEQKSILKRSMSLQSS